MCVRILGNRTSLSRLIPKGFPLSVLSVRIYKKTCTIVHQQWGKDGGETKTDLTKSRTSICMAEPPKPVRQTSLEVTVEEKREESSTDVMTSDLEEDLDTYVIKSVIDPRNNQKVLSIQEAIVEGEKMRVFFFGFLPNTQEKHDKHTIVPMEVL